MAPRKKFKSSKPAVTKKLINNRIQRLVKCGYTPEEAARTATEAAPKDVDKLVAMKTVDIKINEFLAEENFNFREEVLKLDRAAKNRAFRLLNHKFTEREAITLSQKSLGFNEPDDATTPIPVRIVPGRYPYEDFVPGEYNKIERWLVDRINRVPFTKKPWIAEEFYHIAGYLLLICFDQAAVGWVLDLMKKQPWIRFRARAITHKKWLQPERDTINNRIQQRLKKLGLHLYADKNRNYEEEIPVRNEELQNNFQRASGTSNTITDNRVHDGSYVRRNNQQNSNYFSGRGRHQLTDPSQLVNFIDQLRDESCGRNGHTRFSGAGSQVGDDRFGSFSNMYDQQNYTVNRNYSNQYGT